MPQAIPLVHRHVDSLRVADSLCFELGVVESNFAEPPRQSDDIVPTRFGVSHLDGKGSFAFA